MHFVGSLAQTSTQIPFQGLLLNYTPLPCSCPLWDSCFPWGCPVPVQPPHCRTSTGPCAPAVALSPWRISRGEQGPGPALPQPRNRSRIKASLRAALLPAQELYVCARTWLECSAHPKTQFLKPCAESRMQRGVFQYVGRGESSVLDWNFYLVLHKSEIIISSNLHGAHLSFSSP